MRRFDELWRGRNLRHDENETSESFWRGHC